MSGRKARSTLLRFRARSFGVGMRLWLPLAFASIAAVTALVVSSVFSARTERALQGNAKDLAVGSTLGAADQAASAERRGNLTASVQAIAERRRLAIFVFNQHAELISPRHSHGIQLDFIKHWNFAVATALDGHRFTDTIDNGKGTLVALKVPRAGGVVLTYAPRPELLGQVGIVHHQIAQAALFASLAGALAGLLVAMVIASRLRRIAAAADEIERGRFETRLHPWLHDELGKLAETVDRMRVRLRETFGRLEAERDRLRRLLERLHDGVVAVDEDLRVEFGNTAARRLLRASLGEGDPLPDPWTEMSLRKLAQSLFKPGMRIAQEMVSTRDGAVFTVVGIPPRGRSKSAVLVVTDVSERERRERAEREFVTNAAHELRTPLATITGAVQVLQSGAKDIPDERERFLGHIEREAARLGRLTNALLVLARAQTREEAPNLAPIALAPLLETIAEDSQPPPSVKIYLDCPAHLEVLAERDLLEQALSNLVANSLQNTERGSISIAARESPHGSVTIEVKDTGRGIPVDRQERIFDRFYRPGGRDPGRFGLGLAIVSQAVTALGGTLELDSAAGRGTTVTMTFAATPAEAVA